MKTQLWVFSAVVSLSLLSVSCGNKTDFDNDVIRTVLGSTPVNLDGEQVTISQKQLDCGVQSELWESPSQVSQERSTAHLTAKGHELNFGDDPTIEPRFHFPYAQVRGAFSLEAGDVSGIRDGDAEGTKQADVKIAIKLQHSCFSNALPVMGVKHGNFQEDTPVTVQFRFADDGWHVDKLVH